MQASAKHLGTVKIGWVLALFLFAFSASATNLSLPTEYQAKTLRISIRDQILNLHTVQNLIHEDRPQEACRRLRQMAFSEMRPLVVARSNLNDLKQKVDLSSTNFILPNGKLVNADSLTRLFSAATPENLKEQPCLEGESGRPTKDPVFTNAFREKLDSAVSANQNLLNALQ